MSDRIRVLIADDHAPTRQDIKTIIEADPRFEVVAEAADASSAVQGAITEGPDLCLLDINMPGNGTAAAWEISSRLPDAKIVMLTVSHDDRDLFASLRAGASGYLLKDIDPDRLPHALYDVLRGEAAAIPRALVARIIQEFRDTSPRRRSVVNERTQAPLTSREWEVLEFLRGGLSTADIAARLSVSAATVRSHVAAVLRKLRVPDRESAVRLFEER
jgi:DNA-binding NarL/FixJ family response regulator